MRPDFPHLKGHLQQRLPELGHRHLRLPGGRLFAGHHPYRPGAGDSVRLTQKRLGADILVVPEGNERKVEGALLMGSTAQIRMPTANLAKIRAIPGVEVASPQLYLMSMSNSSCCSVPDMFMVAYDPATDFTVEPWLKEEFGRELDAGRGRGRHLHLRPPGRREDQALRIRPQPDGQSRTHRIEPRRHHLLHFRDGHEMARISTTKARQLLYVSPEIDLLRPRQGRPGLRRQAGGRRHP